MTSKSGKGEDPSSSSSSSTASATNESVTLELEAVAKPGATNDSFRSKDKKHLVVLVHGLFGSDKHFKYVVEAMEANFSSESICVYVSRANKRAKTLDGIQDCGERLIEEVNAFLQTQQSFRTISIVGHSLGGLIARYAIGQTYDPEKKTIFGLEPLHYIAICTPHFGCNDTYMSDIRKEDSVTPCLRWAGQIPCLGKIPAFLFYVFESFFVCLVLRRTGDQLFLRDKDPIILQMGSYSQQDTTGGGDEKGDTEKVAPYLDALASFKERTCYGNIRGDHVVAWENATIRRKCDLPKISSKEVPYGVVNEEVSPACPPEGPSEELVPIHHSPSRATCPKVEVMISNLEALGWRRVDVKTKILIHKGAPWAHDNIISKKDIHDNFKTVALHSSSLLINTVKRYETDNVV
mmetsp:Transcript_12046/g.34068  ORF Transcript_12046/g.34068 Transcript_12046/m.34068 type:complete len:407 (+) Transcript_12046:128-1348(+)